MTLAVKLLADTFWYCASLAPAFLAFNRFFRLLFGLAQRIQPSFYLCFSFIGLFLCQMSQRRGSGRSSKPALIHCRAGFFHACRISGHIDSRHACLHVRVMYRHPSAQFRDKFMMDSRHLGQFRQRPEPHGDTDSVYLSL